MLFAPDTPQRNYKSLSDIMSIMQERPDVAVRSVTNTHDGRLVRMSSTQLADNNKGLFKVDWDNAIRKYALSLILVAAALFLILMGSICNSLMDIDRSLTRIADFPNKIAHSFNANLPSLVGTTKARPVEPQAFLQMRRETMPLPPEVNMEHRDDSTSALPTTSNNKSKTTTPRVEEEAPDEELQQEDIKQTETTASITIPAMDNDVLIVPPDILKPLNNIVDSKDDANTSFRYALKGYSMHRISIRPKGLLNAPLWNRRCIG